MKVSEIAHIDPRVMEANNKWQQSERAKYAREHKNEARDKVFQAINDNPGVSYRELRYKFLIGMKEGTLSGVLSKSSQRGEIKRVLQDGKKRYYPKNYLVMPPTKHIGSMAEEIKELNEKKKTEVVQIEPLKEFIGDKIEQKIKDYIWDKAPSRYDIVALRDFVEWVKREDK